MYKLKTHLTESMSPIDENRGVLQGGISTLIHGWNRSRIEEGLCDANELWVVYHGNRCSTEGGGETKCTRGIGGNNLTHS